MNFLNENATVVGLKEGDGVFIKKTVVFNLNIFDFCNVFKIFKKFMVFNFFYGF